MYKLIKNIFLFFVLSISFVSQAYAVSRTNIAQKLYNKSKDSVYQIQTIDLATNEKTSIGSGFRINKKGYIVSNYHVVSSVVLNPDKYRSVYLDEDGSKHDLEVLAIDVVHDIAILQSKNLSSDFLSLANSNLSKGEKIFSMGNPHDLGMTIVEGNYNGLLDESMYKKILFSGSLNPGMSGGPVLDEKGKVIGINVATQGNQISFLVPVEYVKNCLEQVKISVKKNKQDWYQIIEDQLYSHQNKIVSSLLDIPEWTKNQLGGYEVPGKIAQYFKSWSSTKDNDKMKIKLSTLSIESPDTIYLDRHFTSGKIRITYTLAENKRHIGSAFWKFLSKVFKRNSFSFTHVHEENVDPLKSYEGFVKIVGQDWKVGTSARKYTKFPKLYDYKLSMVSLSEKNKGLTIDIALHGISKENALFFAQAFIRNIEWKK